MALSGCRNDCDQACAIARQSIGRCLGEWSAEWEDLDATDGADWRDQCRSDWNRVSSNLESRELTEALEACQLVVDETPQLSCDELRAIYLE